VLVNKNKQQTKMNTVNVSRSRNWLRSGSWFGLFVLLVLGLLLSVQFSYAKHREGGNNDKGGGHGKHGGGGSGGGSGGGGSTGWSAVSINGQNAGATAGVNGDVTTLVLPSEQDKIRLVAFLTTEESQYIGNLTGKSIVSTIDISTVGTPVFVYPNEGYNCPPEEAFVRLYFTTVPGSYDLGNANSNETEYWWSDTAFSYMVNAEGGVALVANVGILLNGATRSGIVEGMPATRLPSSPRPATWQKWALPSQAAASSMLATE
jgi:hypothetical protein